MKVIRLLVYEGEPKFMEQQLGLSLPDGTKEVRDGKIKIKVITLGTLPAFIDMLLDKEEDNDKS